MATSEQLRTWWLEYRCDTTKMVRVAFPGPDRTWNLLVASGAAAAWDAFAQVMRLEGYLFREVAGGTYNCRQIAGTNLWSLHSYGIAVDLNPSKNPHSKPLTTDMPQAFRDRVATIMANGKRCFEWGGTWDLPDAMHFEIDVHPEDIAEGVTFDQGDDVALTEKEENVVRDLLAALEATGAMKQTSRQELLNKMALIGKNYPITPDTGTGDNPGVQRGETVTITGTLD